MKKLLIAALALAVVVTMLAVPAVAGADPGATLSVTGDANDDVDYPGEVDSHFSTVTIPHNPPGQITVAGKVELGGFEAAPANTVWYELGLVSDDAYTNVDRIHNKGVYMIALWNGTEYQVHMQNVPGVKPDAVGNYLGTGDCYFKLPSSTFLFMVHYYGPITSTGGQVELWVSEGENWDNIQGPKLYKYAETDVEVFYGLTHEQAVALGYAADDDFTVGNARIVSQLFTGGMSGATDGQTFNATYDEINSGGTLYTLSPREGPTPTPTPPPTPTLAAYLDIGNTTSEDGHNLKGWGDQQGSIPPGVGGYGGVDDCRCTVNASECGDPDKSWASFDMSTGAGKKATELRLRVLDGLTDDSFTVDVNGNLLDPYADQYNTETWVIHSYDISDLNLRGNIAVTINSTGVMWDPGCYTWGQLAVDWAELYTVPVTDGEGGMACFIATAAYGTASAEEIDVLRAFRDEVLMESQVGSQLVEWYYQTSPPVADFISGNSLLRTIVRELVIDPIVSIATFTQGMWGK